MRGTRVAGCGMRGARRGARDATRHRARATRPAPHVPRMKVLLTLQDVEPAVRLNALLESEGVETAVVSPLDDMRASIRREKPDIIVFSGDLADPASIALVKEQL